LLHHRENPLSVDDRIVNNLIINNEVVMATQVFAEVTGTVWAVEVHAGQEVSEGDTLLIVESMKMEIPVTASVAGKVTEVLVTQGDMVEDGQCVVVLE
jgi:acetyl-CoA carboxylase biotin carboxyl carrier protein